MPDRHPGPPAPPRRGAKQTAYDWLQLAKLRRSGASFPPVAEAAAGRANLFIGPVNSAGQGQAWARAAELVGAERAGAGIAATAMSFTREGGFGFAIDQAVPSAYGAHSRSWQRRQFAALTRFDAALLESGRPPLAGLFGGDPSTQYRALAAAGVRTALLFHGSDIRDPDRHLAIEPHSHYADSDFVRTFRKVSARTRSLAAATGAPVFASTPDLYDELVGDLPDVRWLPVVIDGDRWRTEAAPFAGSGPLRVVHVPSKSTIKGTDLIEPALHALHSAGRIDYRSVSGVPHAEMPGVIADADVVLDQFRVGGYGVAACEALAAGRLVVSHVLESAREQTRRLTGEELPIVEATPETLESVLEDVRSRPEHYGRIAARGPEFVLRHHDGRRSGAVLADWMGVADPRGDATEKAEEAHR